MKFWSSFFILLLIPFYSLAVTVFPLNLDKVERQALLSTMGFGTAPKVLSNPYPLGGYEGWEFGASSEFLSLQKVAGLGSAPVGQTVSRGEFNFYNLSLSKGIYQNIDTALSFMPSLQGESIAGFGVSLRWTFYESPYIPLALATNIYGGGVNIQSKLSSQTTGIDLLCTMAMDDLALYFGVGQAKVVGVFTGGTGGLTDNGETTKEGLSSSHSLFGLAFQLSKMQIAFQVDRYVDPTYGLKVGLRY